MGQVSPAAPSPEAGAFEQAERALPAHLGDRRVPAVDLRGFGLSDPCDYSRTRSA